MDVSSIKAEMARRDLGIEQLGEIIGVEYSATYKRISGETRFTIDELIALADEWNVSLEYLTCRNTDIIR